MLLISLEGSQRVRLSTLLSLFTEMLLAKGACPKRAQFLSDNISQRVVVARARKKLCLGLRTILVGATTTIKIEHMAV